MLSGVVNTLNFTKNNFYLFFNIKINDIFSFSSLQLIFSFLFLLYSLSLNQISIFDKFSIPFLFFLFSKNKYTSIQSKFSLYYSIWNRIWIWFSLIFLDLTNFSNDFSLQFLYFILFFFNYYLNIFHCKSQIPYNIACWTFLFLFLVFVFNCSFFLIR